MGSTLARAMALVLFVLFVSFCLFVLFYFLFCPFPPFWYSINLVLGKSPGYLLLDHCHCVVICSLSFRQFWRGTFLGSFGRHGHHASWGWRKWSPFVFGSGLGEPWQHLESKFISVQCPSGISDFSSGRKINSRNCNEVWNVEIGDSMDCQACKRMLARAWAKFLAAKRLGGAAF